MICVFNRQGSLPLNLAQTIYKWNGSDFQVRAFDAEDGSVEYTNDLLFNNCWGGISTVDNKLFIADNYGRETGSSAPAVPEPGGLALLTPAAIILLKRRATTRGHSRGGR